MKRLYQIHGEDLVREIGTDVQKELLEAGALPDLELDEIIRTHLFAGIEGWPRWRRVKEGTVRELAISQGKSNGQDRVRFETVEISKDDLTAEQVAIIDELWGLMPEALCIEPLWIISWCGELMVKFPKVRVTINYHGRIFQQELKL